MTKTSKATLKKAAKLLQKAHDHIETVGFNINSYRPEKWGTKGPACYIGTIRHFAGVPSEPEGGYSDTPADLDDGPELTVVLSLLDKCAKRTKFGREYGYSHQHVGRFVEAVGMRLNELKIDPNEQQAYALKIFRSALREIHKELV